MTQSRREKGNFVNFSLSLLLPLPTFVMHNKWDQFSARCYSVSNAVAAKKIFFWSIWLTSAHFCEEIAKKSRTTTKNFLQFRKIFSRINHIATFTIALFFYFRSNSAPSSKLFPTEFLAFGCRFDPWQVRDETCVDRWSRGAAQYAIAHQSYDNLTWLSEIQRTAAGTEKEHKNMKFCEMWKW